MKAGCVLDKRSEKKGGGSRRYTDFRESRLFGTKICKAGSSNVFDKFMFPEKMAPVSFSTLIDHQLIFKVHYKHGNGRQVCRLVSGNLRN